MLRTPSLQRTTDDFWPGDPAFVQPPERAEGQSEETFLESVKEYESKLRVARETGNWSSMLGGGDGQPTKFVFRRIPGDVYRKLVDDAMFGRIGPGEYAQMMVRLALVDVVNLGDAKVEIAKTERYGRIATLDIVNRLDDITPHIVRDLAEEIRKRQEAVSPKS